jgi:O-antigen/teichoic acid export membrane protein
MISFITFFLLGGLYLVSEELIVFLFGEKWLPSVFFFQILALSGFVQPMGAVLMNILTSRGKSKIVLKMAVYKLIVALINFGVLYQWGIAALLYGLIIVGLWDLFLNILFAAKEIRLSFMTFAKPFVVQVLIAVFSVLLSQMATASLQMVDILMLLLKGTLFTMLYILINYVLRTSSFDYFLEQLIPMVKKRMHK